MSLSITFHGTVDGEFTFSLASAVGWKLATKWMNSLPAKFGKLHTLSKKGEIKDTLTLSNELKEALDRLPPEDKNVRTTIKDLIDTIGIGDSDEYATVLMD
jgi:hypothetical protein